MSVLADRPKTIGIIGAAVAGPVLAIQILSHPILRQRFKPVIFDRSNDIGLSASGSWESQQTAGAGVAIFANGLYPLYELGLSEAIQNAGYRNNEVAFWRSGYGKDGKVGEHKFLGAMRDVDTEYGLIALERRALQTVLINQTKELGGEIHWSKSLTHIESNAQGKTVVTFNEIEHQEFDLVVGADGAFSRVRKYILTKVNPDTAEKRWLPSSEHSDGIYGVSSGFEEILQPDPKQAANTQGVWLPVGNLSSSKTSPDRVRWDLILPGGKEVRGTRKKDASNDSDSQLNSENWKSKIVAASYPREYTIQLLEKHVDVYHPLTGTFGKLLASSERIIHTPLRQEVWLENEIQHKDGIVVIGDAARTMLPSSGQGTSFAIEDATVLANALLNHYSPSEVLPFAKALQEYAKLRVPRSRRMASMASMAGKMGLGETWYWRAVRDISSWMAGFSTSQNVAKSWPFNERLDIESKI